MPQDFLPRRRRDLPLPSPHEMAPAFDPVCGMRVDAWDFRHVSRWNGMDARFCSSDCKQTFDMFPERFTKVVPA